jgi:hypothetical protein
MLHESSESGAQARAKNASAKRMQEATKMPPRMAIWLIESWGAPRYRSDLLGDLVEQYRAGRSRAWCWRQAAWSLGLARVEAFRASPWMTAVKALIVAFGVVTLGVSTLSWAESVHEVACTAASCAAAAPATPGR